MEKILECKRITDKTKEDLRSGKVSINEAYEMVVLESRVSIIISEMSKTFDELKKSDAEIDNQPERTKEETERLRAKGELRAEIRKAFRNNFEKRIERDKACAPFYFWYEYRVNKNNDIESVASETLREMVRLGTENEMQTTPWQQIEQILYHAVIENKINVNEIRNSKAIQASWSYYVKSKKQEIKTSLDLRTITIVCK